MLTAPESRHWSKPASRADDAAHTASHIVHATAAGVGGAGARGAELDLAVPVTM